MSKFLTNVTLHRYPEQENTFQLDSDLIFNYNDCYIITVYPGFVTDGASVPNALRWFVDPFSGNYLPGAILHDALYRSQILSREESDLIFLDAMKTCKVGWIKSELMFQAVSLFGWKIWKENEKDKYHARNYINLR